MVHLFMPESKCKAAGTGSESRPGSFIKALAASPRGIEPSGPTVQTACTREAV